MIVKRLFDLVVVIPSIVVFIPLFFLIGIVIKLDSNGPVFFRQIRVGKSGKEFSIFKFRTMIVDAEAKGLQISTSTDSRITKTGAVLRKYKLDELPQLINVFFGQMSLVGPRPEVPKYVACYPIDIKDKILSMQPGITDLASIEFSNENEMLENLDNAEKEYIENILPIKFKYYLNYVDKHSLVGDLKIIAMTIFKIIRH
jgi:lipopolysaccharide/colanic/teichoic acid biosynthesis glycosyltransferase